MNRSVGRRFVMWLLGASWLACVGEDAPALPDAIDAGSTNDAANASADVRDAPTDGTDTSDAEGDAAINAGDGGGIACGNRFCDPSSQVCCGEIGAMDHGSTDPLRCVARNACSGTSPMNIPCDDQADCLVSHPTSPVCCAGTSVGDPGGRFILFECTIPAGCATTANVRHERMCSGATDSSCPVGMTCRAGLLRDGYFTCQ